jgi:DNA helicase-2/ATP-dependent DNA helicase PcrA
MGALVYLFPQFHAVCMAAPAQTRPLQIYYQSCLDQFNNLVYRPEYGALLAWVRERSKAHAALGEAPDTLFSELLYQLIQFPPFAGLLNSERMREAPARQRAMQNLALLSRLLVRFELNNGRDAQPSPRLSARLRELFNQYFRFLMEGGIRENEERAEAAPPGAVAFLTIHQAKGLEFPVVIVGSLDAEPRSGYRYPMDVALESCFRRKPIEPPQWLTTFDMKRLYYTAFSRAQNLLVLTWSALSNGNRCPSSFFGETARSLPRWDAAEVRLAELPLKSLPPAAIRRSYSFTGDVQLFEECAEQYRFFRLLNFRPVRQAVRVMGEVVHQTIEDMHRAVLRGELDLLTEAQVTRWLESNFAWLAHQNRLSPPDEWLHAAAENVMRYLQQGVSLWARAQQAEVRLARLLNGYILSGKVDLICRDGDGLEIIDFKTERKPNPDDPQAQQRLLRYQRQLQVYAWLVEQRTGRRVTRTRLYYTSERTGDPWITIPHDAEAIARTIAGFDAVVQRIEARDFAMASRPTHLCRKCDLRTYCDGRPWNLVGD